MAWYGVEAIESALDDAKELLLPFDRSTWLKIALIAFLAGGFNGFNLPTGGGPDVGQTGNENGLGGADLVDPGMAPDAVTGAASAVQEPWLVPAALAGIVLLNVFFIISAVFTFVFYQSVITKNVRIRPYARKHVRNGLQLYGAQLALFIGLAVVMASVAALFLVNPMVGVAGVLLAIPVVILWAVALQLTGELVPLTMLDHEIGIIAAWKTLYPVLREEWQQTGVYLLLRFALQIAVGIVATIGALAAAIPALPLGVLGFLLSGPAALVLLAVAAVVWGVTFFVFVNGPAQTYLRYYAVNVYNGFMA